MELMSGLGPRRRGTNFASVRLQQTLCFDVRASSSRKNTMSFCGSLVGRRSEPIDSFPKKKEAKASFFFGADERTRTADLILTK